MSDCIDCKHNSMFLEPCNSCHGQAAWETRHAEEKRKPVDSKIAAGSKKTTPFLKALAAVLEYGIAHSHESACIQYKEMLGYWAAARVHPEQRTAMLTSMASCAIRAGAAALEPATHLEVLAEVWRDSMFGESKHGANNWMNAQPEGMWHYEAAMVRHVLDRLLYGELVPEAETVPEAAGVTHVGCIAWNALMILEMHLRGVENPDWVQP